MNSGGILGVLSETILNMQFVVMPFDLRFQNLGGSRFGRLTVLGYAGKIGNQHTWYCECRCSTITQVRGGNLKNKHTTSCGCLMREAAAARNSTHGATKGGKVTTEYTIYNSAKHRCENPNDTRFADYGGRGIQFSFSSFEEFLAELGPRPSTKHSVDRIDNFRGYEPGNIRWATSKQQCRNTRRNVLLKFRGETKCLAEWCEELKLSYGMVRNRLKKGWPVEQALS